VRGWDPWAAARAATAGPCRPGRDSVRVGDSPRSPQSRSSPHRPALGGGGCWAPRPWAPSATGASACVACRPWIPQRHHTRSTSSYQQPNSGAIAGPIVQGSRQVPLGVNARAIFEVWRASSTRRWVTPSLRKVPMLRIRACEKSCMAKSSTRLVPICGLPASGKSTLARQLAPKIPAIRLDKDRSATQLGLNQA